MVPAVSRSRRRQVESRQRATSVDARPVQPRATHAEPFLVRIWTRNNRAFRVVLSTKNGVGPVSPCWADVLRRHLEHRRFAARIWTAMISRWLVAKALI